MSETERAQRPAATGGCLCGAVRYRVRGPLRDVWACHCRQCLKSHGHFGAYTSATREDVEMVEDRGLRWFRSSESARRGFCGICGGRLFWTRDGVPTLSIAAGSLDDPSDLRLAKHIFTEHLAGYYEIADGLEALPRGAGG